MYGLSNDNVSLQLPLNSTRLKLMLNTGLAHALNETHSPTLTTLRVDFDRWSQRNEYNAPIRLVDPMEQDELDLSLHKLTQRSNIHELVLEGSYSVSPAFFWPASPNISPPLWPSLTDLYVELDSTTPCGHWYFIEDTNPRTRLPRGAKFSINDLPDAEDCDGVCGHRVQPKANVMRRFRSYPNPETIEPLLIAMAKAARHMPAIKSLQLTRWKPVEGLIDVIERRRCIRQFGVMYQVKGMTKSLQFVTGAWRPAEAVMREWRQTVGAEGRVEFWQEKVDEDHFLYGLGDLLR